MKEKSVEMTKKRSKLPKYDQKKREKRKKRTKERKNKIRWCIVKSKCFGWNCWKFTEKNVFLFSGNMKIS